MGHTVGTQGSQTMAVSMGKEKEVIQLPGAKGLCSLEAAVQWTLATLPTTAHIPSVPCLMLASTPGVASA